MIRKLINILSKPIICTLRPIKMYAYRTRCALLKRIILEFTTFVDWLLIILNVQNETILLHCDIYRGNFIFGQGIMVTDYQSAADNLVKPLEKNNNFMCVPIITNKREIFATYSPILQQNPPVRELTRNYLDTHVFTPQVREHSYESIQTICQDILKEWAASPKMTNNFKLRSVVTRIFIKLLADVTLTPEEAESVTCQYLRRFAEFSFFGYYFPFMLGLLGSRHHMRTDVFNKLKAHGIDPMVTETTLFSAMLSIGTLTIRCVENVQRHGINYQTLNNRDKLNYLIESLRLYPTVATVHRILEQDETVMVCNKELKLTAGDEIAYPFICSHRDETVFKDPEKFDIHRPSEEYEKVLSWSKGQHKCPGRDLSILVTLLMLDKLGEKHDLTQLRIFEVIF